MQFGGGKFNQPDDLMHPEWRIHKLSIQCKTESIAFRETVAYNIGQEPGWIDSTAGLVRILHLHDLMNLICEIVRYTSVE
jgi:hypothetical protein